MIQKLIKNLTIATLLTLTFSHTKTLNQNNSKGVTQGSILRPQLFLSNFTQKIPNVNVSDASV